MSHSRKHTLTNREINAINLTITVPTTGEALVENNEASAKLTTANGGTFT